MATRFNLRRRSRRASVIVALAVAAWAGGCSEQGTAARLPDDAPLVVSTAPSTVTLQNRTGLPLTDVKIVIVPYGPVQFVTSFSRFETSERREISLGEFRSGDGAPLNVRFIKPRSVHVTAKDVVGKSYDIEVPWK